MKKTTFLAFITLLLFNGLNAQVLYTENFNSYTIGNVATLPHLPGQGGWFALGSYGSVINDNSMCRIEWESGKDLYLLLESKLSAPTPTYQMVDVHKNIGQFWKERNIKNNILKFEFEFNTHLASSVPNTVNTLSGMLGEELYPDYYYLYVFSDYPLVTPYNRVSPLINTRSPAQLVKPNVWQKIIFYIDYNNYEAYIDFPSANYTAKIYNINPTDDALNLNYLRFALRSEDNLTQKNFFKIDNIKISAIETLPNLNVVYLDSSKFNLYPNPATNIVNITNIENMFIKQVEIYDVAGKLINTQNFNNGTEIQLNIENLTNGTYILHLQTNEGVAVKKLIKK